MVTGVLDWLPSVAWAVFVAWSISRPEPKPAGRHRATPAIPAGTKPAPTPPPERIDAPAHPDSGGGRR